MKDTKVNIGKNVAIDNPFIAASGTCGYGMEYADIIPPHKWGAVVLKTVTLNPRPGNKPPRCCETDSGMLNSIGLANTGIDNLLENKIPALVESYPQTKIIVSIAGETTKEFSMLTEKLENYKNKNVITAVELNFSCPNVSRGGIQFCEDAAAAKEAVVQCRKVSGFPLWAKISPLSPNPVHIAEVCINAGANAIVASNTLPGMGIDIWKQCPILGNGTGGLSGPAIFPVSLRIAYIIAKALPEIFLIGCGGIDCSEKAIAFILAGCNVVEVGAAVFRNPDILEKLLSGLMAYMEKMGCDTIESFKGKALV